MFSCFRPQVHKVYTTPPTVLKEHQDDIERLQAYIKEYSVYTQTPESIQKMIQLTDHVLDHEPRNETLTLCRTMFQHILLQEIRKRFSDAKLLYQMSDWVVIGISEQKKALEQLIHLADQYIEVDPNNVQVQLSQSIYRDQLYAINTTRPPTSLESVE